MGNFYPTPSLVKYPEVGCSDGALSASQWDCLRIIVSAGARESTLLLSQKWVQIIAKIIPLRKPNKSDYASPSAYCLISLLPILSKAIESLIAERIAHLSNQHSLLPGKHFGGFKGKNTLDELVVVQEKIYQVWRDKKVLSLVNFDIQRAFNGVAKDVLCTRLRERRIPESLVN